MIVSINANDIMTRAQTNDRMTCLRMLHYAHSYLIARHFIASMCDDTLTIATFDDDDIVDDVDALRDELRETLRDDVARIACVTNERAQFQMSLQHDAMSSLMSFV